MIRLTVEILKAGGPRRTGELKGMIEISNDETAHGELGNYDVVITPAHGRRRHARVENFPRKRNDVWALIREALAALDKKDGIG